MFKLLQHVNRRKLIYGKKYYMKRNHRPCTDIIFYGYMEYDIVYSDSENDIELDNFAWVKMLNSIVMGVIVSNDIIEIDVDMNEFYRYISKEEYDNLKKD